MLTNFDLWVAIDTSKRNTVDDPIKDATQCGATFAAKLQTKSMIAKIRSQ